MPKPHSIVLAGTYANESRLGRIDTFADRQISRPSAAPVSLQQFSAVGVRFTNVAPSKLCLLLPPQRTPGRPHRSFYVYVLSSAASILRMVSGYLNERDLRMILNHFTGARHKLHRANTHMDELARLVLRLTLNHPITIAPGEPDQGWIPLNVDFPAPDTSPLSAVAADAIQNLRAALDLGASALARKNGVTSNIKLRDIYFPIGNDRTDWRRRCAALGALIGASAQQAIEAIDAYPGGSGYPLVVLAKLSNIDKHRLLLPTAPVAPADVAFGFRNDDLKGVLAKAEMRVGPLMGGKRPVERGDVLLFLASDNSPIARLNVRIQMSIGFDLPDVPVREQATATLHGLAGVVAKTLDGMEGA